MTDNTKRFTDRVDDYIKYRPSYPKEILYYIKKELGVNKNSVVSDIASGTGIFASLIIDEVKTLYAIEPNDNMRIVCEKTLIQKENFISVNATAENTTLENSCLDYITVAQAFHWFDKKEVSKEFKRILKPNGLLILIWNIRNDNTEFLKEYDKILIKHAKEYKNITAKHANEKEIDKFLKEGYKKVSFDNFQMLDLNGVMGRMLSSSYMPKKDTAEYKIIESEIEKLFDKENKDGLIKFNYKTVLYGGEII